MFRHLCFLLLISTAAHAQQYVLQPIDTKTDASFRGMSIPSDSVAWVSGSRGHVLVSTNRGADWTMHRVSGLEKADFRTLHAFDDRNAIIANAGSPAIVLRTSDGGTSWKQMYGNSDSAAFMDGIAFWDERHGIIYGDPIGGRLLLLATSDGGRSWHELPQKSRPAMAKGEASFAASGTAIHCMGRKTVIIATGGKVSRLLVSENRGRKWRSVSTPSLQGAAGTGIFSFAAISRRHWLIAGGDYMRDTLRKDNLFYTTNKGKTWHAPAVTTRGYRECLSVKYDDPRAKRSSKRTVFAVGPTGIDISHDDGRTWKAFADERKLHVMRCSPQQNLILVAGADGKLAIVTTAAR